MRFEEQSGTQYDLASPFRRTKYISRARRMVIRELLVILSALFLCIVIYYGIPYVMKFFG